VKINYLLSFLILIFASSVFAVASVELPGSGITPDSPFYFVDRFFDIFQFSESLVDEKASEVALMAREGSEKDLTKAVENYEKAMTKREKRISKSEGGAEKIVEQFTKHLEVFANVKEKVPEQAKSTIDRAIERNVRGLDKGLDELVLKNPEKAESMTQEIFERLLDNTPESSRKGLQTAFESVQRRDRFSEILIQPGKKKENKPEEKQFELEV